MADAGMIIHATRKLAARLPDVSPEPLHEDSLLGGWHADRLVFDRRQCVLFCHDETRAALFMPGLKKAQFNELGSKWFPLLFTATLAALGCPDNQIARAELALGAVRFDTATNRSVLSSMRIVRYQLEVHIWNAPHVLDADPLALSCRLTDRPATAGGKWLRPRDRLLDLVARLDARRH